METTIYNSKVKTVTRDSSWKPSMTIYHYFMSKPIDDVFVTININDEIDYNTSLNQINEFVLKSSEISFNEVWQNDNDDYWSSYLD